MIRSTIVFATGGTIHFEDGHLMIEDREKLTVAGQTAPGDGITLRFDDGGHTRMKVNVEGEEVELNALRFDLSRTEPGMLNDAFLSLPPREEIGRYRVYGLDYEYRGGKPEFEDD